MLPEERSSLRRYSLLLAFAIVVAIFGLLSWKKPFAYDPSDQQGASVSYAANSPKMLLSPVSFPNISSFIVLKEGIAGKNDIFLCPSINNLACQNLTASPAISEYWPLIDEGTKRIIYFSIGDSSVELYLMDISQGTVTPLTIQAGNSELHVNYKISTDIAPAISFDKERVAFSAKAKQDNAIELFVANTNGQQVLKVTKLGYQVCDYAWYNDTELILATSRGNGVLQHWKAELIGDKYTVTPLAFE